MRWDEEARGAVEVALNDAEVLGLRLGPGGGWCDLLLHVQALPEAGPIGPDPRRLLRLTSPAQVTVLLRTDRTAANGHGPGAPWERDGDRRNLTARAVRAVRVAGRL